MSTSPDGTGSADDSLQQQALGLLRGRANPFDSLVRRQCADENFLDFHEPTVHQPEYEKLLAAIDTYRLEAFAAGDLPDSRVVTVVGPRGAGKTHLLESLAYRTDQQRHCSFGPLTSRHTSPLRKPCSATSSTLCSPRIVAGPATVSGHCGPPGGPTPSPVSGSSESRRAVATNGTQRLAVLATPLGRGWRLWAGRVEQLIADLHRVEQAADLVAAVRAHGIAPAKLIDLAESHLRRSGKRRRCFAGNPPATVFVWSGAFCWTKRMRWASSSKRTSPLPGRGRSIAAKWFGNYCLLWSKCVSWCGCRRSSFSTTWKGCWHHRANWPPTAYEPSSMAWLKPWMELGDCSLSCSPRVGCIATSASKRTPLP